MHCWLWTGFTQCSGVSIVYLKYENADCSKNWIKKLAELFPECLSGLYLLSKLAGKYTINISEEVTNICQERDGLHNANSDLFIYQKE